MFALRNVLDAVKETVVATLESVKDTTVFELPEGTDASTISDPESLLEVEMDESTIAELNTEIESIEENQFAKDEQNKKIYFDLKIKPIYYETKREAKSVSLEEALSKNKKIVIQIYLTFFVFLVGLNLCLPSSDRKRGR